MGPLPDSGIAPVVIIITIIGVIGWGSIEIILWIFSHLRWV